MKKVIWILIYLLMAYSAFSGLWNGWQDWRHSNNSWERFVAALNLAYGIAAVIALPALLLRKSWAFYATLFWAVCTIACAISAIIVFTGKEEGLVAALIGASLGLAAIFVPLVLFVRKNLIAS